MQLGDSESQNAGIQNKMLNRSTKIKFSSGSVRQSTFSQNGVICWGGGGGGGGGVVYKTLNKSVMVAVCFSEVITNPSLENDHARSRR